MIASFCDPHPDELLYSVWARYGDRVRYPYKTMVLQDLFGSSTIRPITDLPCYLKNFIDNLPPGHGYTADYFIDHHTLLPFYAAFFPSERLKRLKEQMNSNDPLRFSARAGITTGRRGIPTPSRLRYCPGCVEEDRALFGECYWHRLHQIPGVELCPIHSILLEQSFLLTRGFENGHGLVSAERAIQLVPPRPAVSSPFFKYLKEIANEVIYLLEHPFTFRDPHLFPQQYHTLLAQHGFMSPRGLIRLGNLIKAFTDYYPQELLKALHCEIEVQGHPRTEWISNLTRNNSHVYHPLYHILVIHLFDSTLEKFHTLDLTLPSPFGKGPWPCLNPVCEHYQQGSILSYHLKKALVNGKIRGVFTCTCGYTYIRYGLDLAPGDIVQKVSVACYGPVWEMKLRELWLDTEVSIKGLARHLGIDPHTAKLHAALLNLPPRRDTTNNPPEKTLPADNTKDRSWYRAQWLAILEEAKDEPPYLIKGRIRVIFSWLVRCDKDWLAAHRPVPRKRQKASTSLAIVNRQNQIYIHHDTLVAEAVRAAAHKVINLPGRPIRVSRKNITLEIPEIRRLRTGMNKMPLATQALQEVVETSEGFALRRIKWTLDRYIEEQSCPAQWKFLARAGLKASILQFQKLQRAFESAMNMLSQFT